MLAWNYPTAARLSRHLAQQTAGEATSDAATPHNGGLTTVAEFERLLTQIESMSRRQIEKALATSGSHHKAKPFDD